jgi:magnesium chelatase family protein
MGNRQINKHCHIDEPGERLLEAAIDKFGLSAGACNRILKMAYTIADLDRREKIITLHLSEVIQYRSLDRNLL